MKNLIKRLVRILGYEITPYQKADVPGSPGRPIGNFPQFLEDIKARDFYPHQVLDVGANRGDWSRMAKTLWPKAKFLLIEPQLEMRNHLDRLCDEFNDMVWVEAGAGSTVGRQTLTIWNDLAGSSFLPEPDQSLLKTGKQREVDILTIDSLLNRLSFPIPQLAKLDIQGFELEALKGASSLFGKTELFILEVSIYASDLCWNKPLLYEVFCFMAERGYKLYDIPGFIRRPYDGALGQLDIAFARADGMLMRSNTWS